MARFLLLAAPLLLLVAGCGGYASTSEAFRQSLTRGRPDQALKAVNEALEVDRPEDLPKRHGADTPLLLLERATILQALGRHDLSQRDFQAADAKLEVLDYTSDTAGDIGKYLWSDDAQVYRAPPHEKLLLNTLNLLNYLARGDAQGAKVEARRFTVNQKYLKDAEGNGKALMALGSYLSAFAFEVSGDPESAMRYYADAQTSGGLPTLTESVRRLAKRTGASDNRLQGMLDNLRELPEDDRERGELLVITQVGMAPFRVPERLPIGAAIVAASAPGPGARLTASERARANTFAAKGMLKWVNYPKLRKAPIGARGVNVTLDGRTLPGGEALDVEARVVKSFRESEGTLLAAAIVRLLTRAVAGELSQGAAKKAGGGGIGSLLIGLAVEGAMTAADTPDTRSWVTLPARFHLARTRVPAGRHTVEVRIGPFRRQKVVEVKPGGYAVVNFSDQR